MISLFQDLMILLLYFVVSS